MRQTDFFTKQDICAVNHGCNAESNAAFGEGKELLRQRVLAEIRKAGTRGLTVDELSKHWGVGCNALSGRFSELKVNSLIEKVGTRPTRTGSNAGVYVATKQNT